MILHPIIDLLKRIVIALPDYTGGGTSITDGIIVKQRNSDGYATEVDLYCTDKIYKYTFGCQGSGALIWPYKYLSSVNVIGEITEIGANAFAKIPITAFDIPETVTTIGVSAFANTSITDIVIPNVPNLPATVFSMSALKNVSCPYTVTYYGLNNATGVFYSCTSLENVEMGSIGHTVTSVGQNTFQSCTQSGLTITVFTTSNYVDTILSIIRNRATNATIIIKASENTTYNSVDYAAGDTIVTSEVTP